MRTMNAQTFLDDLSRSHRSGSTQIFLDDAEENFETVVQGSSSPALTEGGSKINLISFGIYSKINLMLTISLFNREGEAIKVNYQPGLTVSEAVYPNGIPVIIQREAGLVG